MLGGLFYLGLGVFLTWIGWRHWRLRGRETIAILEAAISQATGEEPLPRTRFDPIFGYVQAVLGFVLGPFFFLCGLAVLFS